MPATPPTEEFSIGNACCKTNHDLLKTGYAIKAGLACQEPGPRPTDSYQVCVTSHLRPWWYAPFCTNLKLHTIEQYPPHPLNVGHTFISIIGTNYSSFAFQFYCNTQFPPCTLALSHWIWDYYHISSP